ncbi:enoyl-CoA hydratase/isomerase family protein [Blastococcus sp. CT_GayMR20]|uniref:enoyl-CoA hydratase/isomerase family protein n=1 Tax=Blastococcus sp. CT_GayMR20 TaxID=2559609 RepID=UPI0010749BA3|nr:enoyl-CoA hydratase/isomerase family protein [Blastococcus sp. CT_GayMR20]TFV82796.1 enoyl-CoA hydratase/isomerase family protein [Blastococcus sp. CT_GayMR20]
MAGSGEVLLEVDGGVAIVTLNAPDRRNALTPAMAEELIATFDEVDAKPEVGALVIRAEGKSFCAGGDIATLTSAGKDPAAPEAYEGMGRIYDSFYRLGQVKVPTVAAVRGSAVGAGMNMLLAADLRIVAKDARLLCGFLKRGMHPGGGHFVILSRLIGREAAAAMALFGEEINGDKAVELGLAWRAPDDQNVDVQAIELAGRVASDPELARVAVGNFRKEVINGAVDWDVATQYERPAQMWSMRRSARD